MHPSVSAVILGTFYEFRRDRTTLGNALTCPDDCRYHGDMSIFDHHDDGIIAQPGEVSPRRRPSSPGLSDEEIDIQQVSWAAFLLLL